MRENKVRDRGRRRLVGDIIKLTGDGRCKRLAASLSPGASNVTTGAPNVTPTRLASDPPRECPMIQMLE
jgi:hypothetical protein